jgi:predicted helicase
MIHYISELSRIYKTGNATEHSYRPALQHLLERITDGLQITNEPKRIACGAPDYIVTRNDIPVGYIEAKDIGVDLNSKANKEQFDRYKQSLGNLIITDYLTFQLFEDGEQIVSVTIGKITQNAIEADSSQFETFLEMLRLFSGYEGQWIQTSEQLSKIMAVKARLLANIIDNALESKEENGNNSLNDQLTGFREVLIHDITHKEFSDIYAQTIAYGMFAAKLNDETATIFTRGKAAQLIPLSNPFLRKFFQYIAGYDLDSRISWVVDALADLFNYVDIPAILKEFDKKEHDPIIHFYETFLAEYDPALRKSRGVWYTPQPVVQFIVRAVDDILKTEFGLPQGLADSSKVKLKQNIKQKDGSVAKEEKEYHRVQILDPATGTGTFLSEVVNNIYARFKTQQGIWNSYVSQHLIPRINGFEILMASYAVAHLKLDILLQQTGYKPADNKRLRIYLTNSLEEAHPKIEIPFAQWLSDESNEASSIKQDVPVMVVLGNPPYSVSSQNKGKWIQDLVNDYKKGLDERNIQPLSDDYIKFIRYGQYFIEKNGHGILAYISNNSFIDGLIHSQMRKNLLETFDTIYILDLHGNTRKKETIPGDGRDVNVFDMQQGVSINIFVKTGQKKAHELARVWHHDLYGKRQDKYSFLLNNSLTSVTWSNLPTQAPQHFFVPKNFDDKQEYEKGFKVDNLFCTHTSGIKTHDDKSLISFTQFKQNNYPYHFRPFDLRNINYDLKRVKRHRYSVMRHMLMENNLSLLIPKQSITEEYGFFIANTINDINYTGIAGQYGAGLTFPLYLHSQPDKLFSDAKRKPNLDEAIVAEIAQCIGWSFTEEKEETENTFAPIDILDYIYAVLHSPSYRERYKEFLKIDFPRVPYPQDARQFSELATLGAKLRRLHLMEGVEPSPDMATYPKEGSNEVEKPNYVTGKVYINDAQYFDNVPLEAWEFYIGGYQPAQKWLKDRKGRTLGYEDIIHYQRIIRVLWETGEVMRMLNGKQ